MTVKGTPPLIIITTNEERVLPDAFVRRCLVLHLLVPSDEEELVAYLTKRGQAHFGRQTTDEVLHEAARHLVRDRRFAEEPLLSPLPGQAEYLDLVRAVIGLAKTASEQADLLASAARFTLQKHPEMRRRATEIES